MAGPSMHDHGLHAKHSGRGPGRHRGGRGRGRGKSRVSRGEVRRAALMLLTEEPMHGYQIMQELEERSGGGWHPSPGSVYPTLQQLADEGLIEARPEGGKNIFTLTTEGIAAAELIEGPPVWERFGADGKADLLDLRRAVFTLGAAAKQVSATGTDRQIEAARKVLNDARKALYQLLAEDDDGPEGDTPDDAGAGR